MVVARFIRCWEEQMLLLHAFVFIELLYKSMSTISFYPNRSIYVYKQRHVSYTALIHCSSEKNFM